MCWLSSHCTDMHRLREIEPDPDETKALRALTRARQELVSGRDSLANQLRAELERFWPGAARIFADVDSPIALAFLERYPSPEDARGLGEKRLQRFLARQRYSGRRSPVELLERLRRAPYGCNGELELEARRTVALRLVASLRPLVAGIEQLDSEIAHVLRAHPDGAIFLSLFRDPKTQSHRSRARGRDRRQPRPLPRLAALEADAGMCAVAVESAASSRRELPAGSDHRLRDAVATLADASRHHHPWPPTSTVERALGAATTRTRSASSAAPGCA